MFPISLYHEDGITYLLQGQITREFKDRYNQAILRVNSPTVTGGSYDNPEIRRNAVYINGSNEELDYGIQRINDATKETFNILNNFLTKVKLQMGYNEW